MTMTMKSENFEAKWREKIVRRTIITGDRSGGWTKSISSLEGSCGSYCWKPFGSSTEVVFSWLWRWCQLWWLWVKRIISNATIQISMLIAWSLESSEILVFYFRYLQTLSTISAEHNSTIVFPMPINIIEHFMRWRSTLSNISCNGHQDHWQRKC